MANNKEIFICTFFVEEMVGPDITDTQRRDLTEISVEAKSKEEATSLCEDMRSALVDPMPEYGPTIENEEGIGVSVESVQKMLVRLEGNRLDIVANLA